MPLSAQADKTVTYGDYLTWDDEERWEIIDGVPFNMTPAPSTMHQWILIELGRQFANFLLDAPCSVFPAPFDVRLPKGDEDDRFITDVVQPDLVVVCDPEKLDEKGCRGAPDLVIEILSTSTASKDIREKRCLYEKHGVREYWIVDPHYQLVTVYLLGEDGRFEAPKVFNPEDKPAVVVLPELTIDLERVFRD